LASKKKVPISFWEEQLEKEKLLRTDPEKIKFIRNVLISEYTSLYKKYLDKGNYKKTNEINDKIHGLKKEIDVSSKEDVVWLFEKKALDYLQNSSYDEAISYFKIALDRSSTISSIKTEEIKNIKDSFKKALLDKAYYCISQNKYDDAITSFNKILDFCLENSGKNSNETIEALENLIKCYNQKGNYLSDRGRYEEAIATFEKAIELKNQMNLIESEEIDLSRKNIIKIQTLMAFNYSEKGLYDQALSSLKKVLDSVIDSYGIDSIEYTDAKENLIKINNTKAKSLFEKTRYDEAISTFEKSIEIAKGRGISSKSVSDAIDGIIKSYYQKSCTYEEYGKYEDCIHNLEKALEIASKHKINKIRTNYITDKLFSILKDQYILYSKQHSPQKMNEILNIALNLIKEGHSSANFDETTIRSYFEKFKNQQTDDQNRRTYEKYQYKYKERRENKHEESKNVLEEISIKELLIKFELEDSENITKELIKEQYRYWVDLLHPDKNQNKSDVTRKKAEEKLKEINTIYKKLIEQYA